MELVDLKNVRDRSRRRSRRAGSAKSFREPLLDDNDDSDPHTSTILPSDAADRLYRPSRIGAAAGNLGWFGNGQAVVPPTGVQTYIPPQPGRVSSIGVALGSSAAVTVQGDNVPDYYAPRIPELYFNGPQPPSLMRSVRRQTPERTMSMSSRSAPLSSATHHARDGRPLEFNGDDDNPAQDLGGILSYGFFCLQCVRTQEVGIIENFGQFQELLGPGVYCLMWPFSDISGRLSLRIQILDVCCETKTRDNVFVHMSVSVLFKVILDKSYDAYYRLTDPRMQIRSYVFDVIRSTVPRLTLDEVFASKSVIACDVRERLHDVMHDYGYEIKETLVTDISPDPLVRASMNEIDASRRLKEATAHRAESEKLQTIKAAEALAEASYLSGVGIARQREAVAKGMKESVSQFLSRDRVRPEDAMTVLLLSQYLDTLSVIGAKDMIVNPNPEEAFRIRRQLETELPCTSLKTNLIPDLLS